jgi:hypothetical protein
MSRTPAFWLLWEAARIAARTAETLGDAKIPPRIAPDSIPDPIHPACDGSWPLPGEKGRKYEEGFGKMRTPFELYLTAT